MRLDIGCGSHPRGEVGVDLSFTAPETGYRPENLDPYAGSKLEGAMLVRASADAGLPFRDSCFDEVKLVHVLEHLKQPLSALLEARRVLRPRGRILIVVPNARLNDADWRDETHLYSFTPPTARRLASLVFNVERVEEIINGMDILVEARPFYPVL